MKQKIYFKKNPSTAENSKRLLCVHLAEIFKKKSGYNLKKKNKKWEDCDSAHL